MTETPRELSPDVTDRIIKLMIYLKCTEAQVMSLVLLYPATYVQICAAMDDLAAAEAEQDEYCKHVRLLWESVDEE